MHVDEQMLAPIRARYGEPRVLAWAGEISDPELALITYSPGRRHDVTLFIADRGDVQKQGPRGQLADTRLIGDNRR